MKNDNPDKYGALAVLLGDAILEQDEAALIVGQRGLQRLSARLLAGGDLAPGQHEERGRLLSLLDIVDWTLRRITPVATLDNLRHGATDRRVLELLADEGALSDQELADMLGIDAAAVADTRNRLHAVGAICARGPGDHRLWEITPRGRDALLIRLSLRLDSRGVRRVAHEILEPDQQDGRYRRRRPVTSGIVAALLTADQRLSAEELADETRHTLRRVKLGLNALVDRGIIRRERDGKEGGERFAVRDERYCVIGIEILQGKALGIVAGLRGAPLFADEEGLPDMQPERVADAVAALVDRLRHEAAVGDPHRSQLLGLGVELGGHVDGASGEVVLSGNIRHGSEPWRNVPLRQMLSARTGLPTVVENDVDALAIYQQLFGKIGHDREEFTVIIVGDGVGAGMIVRGDVAHGARGLAGEVGHLVIQPNGRQCTCGNRACLEAYASVPQIIAACAPHDGTAPSSLKEATDRVAAGDELALEAFTQAGEALGRGVAAVRNLVAPREIVIAVPVELAPPGGPPRGGRPHAARAFADAFEETVRGHAYVTSPSEVHMRHIPQLAHYGAQGATAALLRRFVEFPLQWLAVPTVPDHGQPMAGTSVYEEIRTEATAPIAPGAGDIDADFVVAVDDALTSIMG